MGGTMGEKKAKDVTLLKRTRRKTAQNLERGGRKDQTSRKEDGPWKGLSSLLGVTSRSHNREEREVGIKNPPQDRGFLEKRRRTWRENS